MTTGRPENTPSHRTDLIVRNLEANLSDTVDGIEEGTKAGIDGGYDVIQFIKPHLLQPVHIGYHTGLIVLHRLHLHLHLLYPLLPVVVLADDLCQGDSNAQRVRWLGVTNDRRSHRKPSVLTEV